MKYLIVGLLILFFVKFMKAEECNENEELLEEIRRKMNEKIEMPDLSEFPGMQMPEFKQEPINVKKITKCTKQDGKYVITVEAVEGESGNEITTTCVITTDESGNNFQSQCRDGN